MTVTMTDKMTDTMTDTMTDKMVSQPLIDINGNGLNGSNGSGSGSNGYFPIMGNKILFDFLIKPYLNIKTMAALTNVCSSFREYSIVDNNKWWFKYHYVLSVEGKKYHARKHNIPIREIDNKFAKYSKKNTITFIPTLSYYHRTVFSKVFLVNNNMFENTKENIDIQRNLIKVTLTQKDQLDLLFPDKPSRILDAIKNCYTVVERAEVDIEKLKKLLVSLQLFIDIRQNIRLFEKVHLGSTSPL